MMAKVFIDLRKFRKILDENFSLYQSKKKKFILGNLMFLWPEKRVIFIIIFTLFKKKSGFKINMHIQFKL